MYPKVSGSAPVWTLEFEDWTDCDWNDLVVEVRLCNFESDTSDTIKISLNVQGGDSARVEPGDSLNLVVAVTDSLCNPVDSFMIDFAVLPVFHSGGHNHDFDTPNGRADPDTGLTDQNGRVTTRFWPRVDTCGELADRDECDFGPFLRGIAGKYKVWAISRNDTTLWDSLHIQSRIRESLAQLEEGNHWNLIGGTTAHPRPSNHYGTLASNQHLRDIGEEFDSTLVARGQPVPEGGLVDYNDQSLIWGGMFDIGPTGEHPEWRLWHCPHCGHHHGRSCDIRKHRNPSLDTLLARIIEEHGDTVGYYESLWHVDFPN